MTVEIAGVGYTTLELKVSYIRAAQTDGTTLTAEGKVTGRRGRLIAHATTTCLILPFTD